MIPIADTHIIPRQALPVQVPSPITVLVAPPGFGKTVYARQLAESFDGEVIWHSLDVFQRDPEILQQTCAELFSEVLATPLLPSTSMMEAAIALTEALRAYHAKPLLYVIDDAHLLLDDERTTGWLQALVNNFPPTMRLILASRAQLPIENVELLARNVLTVIAQDQLQFTADETAAYAKQAHVAVENQVVDALCERFGGWAAGIVLALRSGNSESPQAAFEEMALSMLGQLQQPVREFLLYVSTLDVITIQRCAEILKIDNAKALLARAMRQGLFMMKQAHGHVLHDLFRSFLQTKLAQDDAATYRQLHQAAAEWFARDHDYAREFSHALEAGNHARAVQIAEQVAHIFYDKGRWQVLQTMQQQLVKKDLNVAEISLVCAEIAISSHQLNEANDLLIEAEKLYGQENNRLGWQKVAMFKSVLWLKQGQNAAALQLLETLVEDQTAPEYLRGSALNYAALTCYALGDYHTALGYAQRSKEMHDLYQDRFATGWVLQNLNLIYTALGQMEKAGETITALVVQRRKLNNRLALSYALNNLGFHYHLTEQYTAAYDALKEAYELAVVLPDRHIRGNLAHCLAELERDRAHWEEADYWYRLAWDTVAETDTLTRCNILLSWAHFKIWQKDLNAVCSFVREVSHYLGDSTDNINKVLCAVAAVIELAATEMPANECFAAMLPHLDFLVENRAMLKLSQIIGLALAVAEATGNITSVKIIKDIIGKIAEGGSLQPFIADAAHLPALRPHVHDKRWIAQVNTLRKEANVSAQSNSSIDGTTSYITVKALGVERFWRDGQEVLLSEWRAQAREVFIYLVLEGPQTRGMLTDALWGKQRSEGRNAYNVIMTRIRNALGSNILMSLDDQDGHGINPEITITCDVLNVIRWTEQIENDIGKTRNLAYDLRKSIIACEGEFLPNNESDWVRNWRGRLRDCFIEARIGCGEHEAKYGEDFDSADRHFQRAIVWDPTREATYQSWMKIYFGMATTYRSRIEDIMTLLEKNFLEHLNMSPSDESYQLYHELAQVKRQSR
jgi:ATP/maltotriose-dependent transcriptional regulator MalT/DNA-binding SARP family transcriptional activator